MGNIVTTLKRFLANKNTVTILGVLLGLVVLFIGYNYRIEHAVEKIAIPYAKKTISSTNAITSDAVGTMEVLRSMVNNNKQIISNMSAIISPTQAYCVAEMTSVPEGSFFYKEQVKTCSSVANNVIALLPDGYQPVTIPVDMQSTYGNSMFPGDYIDLYAKMETDNGLLIFGKMISKLQIMDVNDSNGKSVFYDPTASKTPAFLTFAVPDEEVNGVNLFSLLSQAIFLGDRVVTLKPVPKNAAYTAEKGETQVTSEYLKDEILKYTADLPN